MTKGQIRQSLSGYYDVVTEDGAEYRTRARGNFRKKKQTPLVGDFVEFKADKVDEGYILEIYPRKNQLIRPPMANIDTAIVVTACVEPDFSSNLLDRQLVMLEANQVSPVLYFSKFDLLDETKAKKITEIVEYYRQFYPVYLGGLPADQNVLTEMLANLHQQVIVVMGQTGAGKSTLLNQLKPNLNLATGEISKALSRGRHTTRKVSLLPIGDNLLADTPGFSSFELLDIDKESLPLLFPDFTVLQAGCKFRGCLHINEPKCAVKEAVLSEKILPSRYDNYKHFYEAIINQKPKYR
ncbi:GTPase [Ligilactobacillus apodemi DSM 16634 = JCM 16172]|uniref:Small ribosomal subunit biogenesis GTPase RsgA n=1 Tax=Ligilactobacillus apodemi DSM 16634 = JCM 16172 TaxID=1423724 RepID=A0A0R1TYP7_9LACO|nr:ribosome small subunit-dependent GTPase A [Ligilactobacillus apodemi]KRL83717.1 GTPase [Ligilactobacillus apodemi DSM 16634 = JCM 16172]